MSVIRRLIFFTWVRLLFDVEVIFTTEQMVIQVKLSQAHMIYHIFFCSGDWNLRRQSTLLEPKNSKSDKILVSVTADSSFTRKIKDSLDSVLLRKTGNCRRLIISGEKFSSPLIKIFNNIKFSLIKSTRKNKCTG